MLAPRDRGSMFLMQSVKGEKTWNLIFRDIKQENQCHGGEAEYTDASEWWHVVEYWLKKGMKVNHGNPAFTFTLGPMIEPCLSQLQFVTNISTVYLAYISHHPAHFTNYLLKPTPLVLVLNTPKSQWRYYAPLHVNPPRNTQSVSSSSHPPTILPDCGTTQPGSPRST